MEPRKSPSSEPRLTIGAVARATGLSADTIRVWQKRYGFPVPQRRPSGHRVYSLAEVRRLRWISEALARGHRPGQVVALSEARLDALLTGTASMCAVVAAVSGLAELRRAVPAATPILVGGLGARCSHPPGGCVILDDLQGLHAWTRRLSA